MGWSLLCVWVESGLNLGDGRWGDLVVFLVGSKYYSTKGSKDMNSSLYTTITHTLSIEHLTKRDHSEPLNHPKFDMITPHIGPGCLGCSISPASFPPAKASVIGVYGSEKDCAYLNKQRKSLAG